MAAALRTQASRHPPCPVPQGRGLVLQVSVQVGKWGTSRDLPRPLPAASSHPHLSFLLSCFCPARVCTAQAVPSARGPLRPSSSPLTPDWLDPRAPVSLCFDTDASRSRAVPSPVELAVRRPVPGLPCCLPNPKASRCPVHRGCSEGADAAGSTPSPPHRPPASVPHDGCTSCSGPLAFPAAGGGALPWLWLAGSKPSEPRRVQEQWRGTPGPLGTSRTLVSGQCQAFLPEAGLQPKF